MAFISVKVFYSSAQAAVPDRNIVIVHFRSLSERMESRIEAGNINVPSETIELIVISLKSIW